MVVNLSLQGKKTYITALAIVATAAYGWYSGDYTVLEAVTKALEGLGIAALRNGISTDAGGKSSALIEKP